MKNPTKPTLLILLLMLFFLLPTVAAQESVTDDDVNDVAKGLYCPVCESTPLDVCPTLACADWRELIREQLSMGWSKAQIHDYFATQYGDGVLAEPPRRGFNLLLWVIPLLAIAVGGTLFVRTLRNLRTPIANQSGPTAVSANGNTAVLTPPADLQTYITRIETELEERTDE